MEETKLNPQVLRDHGFEEKIMYGYICYVKGEYAVVYNFAWIPCTLESGQPLCSQLYVDTWEQLEALLNG